MIHEDDFARIVSEPSPDLAFVRLEREFRYVYEEHLRDQERQGDGWWKHYTTEYMNHTIEAATTLGLDIFWGWDGFADQVDNIDVSEFYPRFRAEVDRFAVQTQIKHFRSGPPNSVALDPSEKKRLRAYADKIKDIIDKSQLQAAKKERLFDKINAFIAEFDKDRTALQKFNDVVLSLANTGGEAVEELEPAWKWVKMAAAMLGVRQEREQTKLPAPPKRLPAPKRKIAPPKNDRDEMNDEVPF